MEDQTGEASLAEYAKFEIETHFLEEGTKHPSECSSCRFYPLCFGGCKRDWYQDSNGKNHNYFCSSFSQFFTYAEQRILEIAEKGTTIYFLTPYLKKCCYKSRVDRYEAIVPVHPALSCKHRIVKSSVACELI